MVNVVSHVPEDARTVVIQGAGLLGLYGCALLRERGVEQVFCVDLSEERLERVPRFGGLPVAGAPEQYGTARGRILDAAPDGVDAVIEVSGHAAVVPEGIALLRPGGFYALAGMVHPDSALEITGEQLIRKCLTVRGIHNYSPAHLDLALAFLARTIDRYPYETLVSPAFPLADLAGALRMAATRTFPRVALETRTS